jgi:phospholipid/cholesterol/gamma-HCH transport system substrate-binding protein
VSLARIASGVGLALATAAVVVIVTGGSAPYTVTAEFTDAGQIVTGDSVVIGAATVGRVSAVRLSPAGLAEVELQIDGGTAPLRQGTVASIRANSLVGSANRYVSLGPSPGVTPPIPDHGVIPLANTTSPIDLDAVLNAFDASTRQGLRLLIDGGASEYRGRAAAARQTLALLGPALAGTTGVLSELARDRPAFEGLVTQGATVAQAVASRQTELASLVDHADATLTAVASKSGALGQSLTLLPRTFGHAVTTFAGLRSMLGVFDRFVATAKPATAHLAPFLARVRSLLGIARVPIGELAALVSSPGPANDLVDLLNGLPSLAGRIGRVYPQTIASMNSSQDLLDTLREYTPDLAGAISNLAEASANYDADGHYVRALPILGALSYNAPTNTLQPKPGFVDSVSGYETGQGHRCPGGAVQPPPDGSAPITAAAGCERSTTLPGP